MQTQSKVETLKVSRSTSIEELSELAAAQAETTGSGQSELFETHDEHKDRIARLLADLKDEKGPYMHDPRKAYELYYGSILKVIKAKVNDKALSEAIRKQKNLFLKEGRTKNADSRCASVGSMTIVAEVIYAWLDRNGNAMELLTDIQELNIAQRYL